MALAVGLGLATPLVAPLGAPASERPPNILLFISDDHGVEDYGFAGHRFAKTPRIDELAEEGVVFRNGYAPASVCVPSLQALLGGVDPHVWRQIRSDLVAANGPIEPRAESQFIDFTLPRMLRTAGYSSFAGGKMWQGSFEDAGFDSGTMKVNSSNFWIDGVNTFGRESMDELFDWLDVQREPWFAWVAPMVPHHPHDPPDDLLALFEDLPISDEAKAYYANVTRLDRRVGEVLDYLAAEGMAEDTVVIYLADNGWVQRLQGTTPLDNAIGDDDGKASIHNRGLQSPIIVRWPREVSPGRTSHRLLTFEDVYATILDYAGVERPDCTDGHSFRRIAENGRGRWRRHTVYAESEMLRVPFAELADGAFFLRSEYGQFVRTRRWAYNDFEDRGTEELFDLREDPLGLVDVSDAHPRKLRLLRRRAERAARRLARRSCPVD